MANMTLLLDITILLCIGAFALADVDPCVNYTNVEHKGSRSPRCPYEKNDEKCDDLLIPGWFRIQDAENTFPPMTSQCPKLGFCGANYPIWLNGTHPEVKDGVVNRTACMRYSDRCCDQMREIKIINCDGFYVYFLAKAPSCMARYCFDSNLPCPTPPPVTYPSFNSSNGDMYMNSTATTPVARASLLTGFIFSAYRLLDCTVI